MTTTWWDVYFDKVPLAGSRSRKRYFAHAFAFCHSLLKLPPGIFWDEIVHRPWKIIQLLSSRLLASVSQKWKKQRLYFGTFAKQKRNRMFQRNVTEIPSDISNVFKTLARAIFKLVVILKCWQALSVQLPISSLALFFFSLVMVTIVMSSCKWASDSPFSEFQSISKSGNTSDASDTSVQVIHVIQMIQVMQVMLVMQVSQVMQVSLAHLWVDFWVIFCLQIMIIAETT